MAKIKRSSPIRPLPGRGSLNDIGKSGMTINDYAKAVPTNPITPSPSEIMMLAAKKPK